MKERFHTEAELIPGGGGEFIVTLDGRTIFSKKQVGRFPDDGEIVEAIQGLH